jgi:hypothetical protein
MLTLIIGGIGYWLLVEVGIFGRKFKNNTVKYFGKNRKKNQLTKFGVRIFSLTHFLKCIYSICRCSRLYITQLLS